MSEFLSFRGPSPALTWYGGEGLNQRIELSGKVCLNHLSKIANYLSFECDLGQESILVIDLPASWKGTLWACAGLLLGAQIVFISGDRQNSLIHIGADSNTAGISGKSDSFTAETALEGECVLLTDRPDYWVAGAGSAIAAEAVIEIIALNLASLAFGWDRELPDNVLDGQAEVIAQPDVLLSEEHFTESNWADFVCADGTETAGIKTDNTASTVLPDRISARFPTAVPETEILAQDSAAARCAFQTFSARGMFTAVLTSWVNGDTPLVITAAGNPVSVLKSEGFGEYSK
ncbi:TIGR03089 family protein [Arcanobacterium hippocoleae]